MADSRRKLPVVAARTGSMRDRRGRGPRGPLTLPGPLSKRAPELRPSRRETFDELVLSAVEQLSERWKDELGAIEFGAEDVPQLPADWSDEPVPFGSMMPAGPAAPARIVLFRRPIEMRAGSTRDLAALIREVIVEHLADLLGRDPDEIDP